MTKKDILAVLISVSFFFLSYGIAGYFRVNYRLVSSVLIMLSVILAVLVARR
jgi:hypothetical protein